MSARDSTVAMTEASKLTESAGSSPIKGTKSHAADEKAAVGTVFQLRAENPTEPANYELPFAQLEILNTSIGNTDFTAELKDEGKLGLFLPRDRARRTPVPVTLNIANYFAGAYRTIGESMIHLLQKKSELSDEDIRQRIHGYAQDLALGVCTVTYMKLRALLFIEFPDRYDSANLKRPKVISDLPVIAPFAFAIQQLGAVNIANLQDEARYVPVMPDIGHTHGIPTTNHWNPNAYAQAVDFARNIGLHFNVVDLKQKHGTAWWLLRQHYAEGIFELKLPFPEVNFTSAMALTHSLFLNGSNANPSNVIFNLDPCGTEDYGYILRDPHLGINVTTFEVIDDSAKEIVSNV